MRAAFSPALAVMLLSLYACGKPEETASPEPAAGPSFQAIQEGRSEDGAGTVLLFDGPAEQASEAGELRLRLPPTTGVTRVFDTTPVEAGKTYELSVTVKRVGGSDPADIRLILSRDCIEAEEEFSMASATFAADETKEIKVSHRFKRTYPCAKMVLHAQGVEPVVLSISRATLTLAGT